MNRLWIKGTITLILVVATGIIAWMVVDKMDDATFKVAAGVVLALTIFVVVGALFIGKDLLQAYIIHRTIAQDDMNDVRQMTMLASIMNRSRGSVNVNLPKSQQQQGIPMLLNGVVGNQQQRQPAYYDGQYRDTTTPIEME